MRQISRYFLPVVFLLSACQTILPVSEPISPPTPTLKNSSISTGIPVELVPAPPTSTQKANVIPVNSFEQEVYPFTQNGNCTLGEAITAANTLRSVDECPAGEADGSIIELAMGTYLLKAVDESPASHLDGSAWERTPNQLAGLPVVMGNVTIDGNGAMITAEKNTLPTLLITYSPQATITDLTLSGGGLELDTTYTYSYDGGNYWNAGNATLNRVRVENGMADNGGGISNGGSGVLTLVDCVIANNLARYSGGGIKNSGKLTITTSLVESNSANDGGGLALFGGNTFVLNSDIEKNIVQFNGGGILVSPQSKETNLELQNSRVAQNSASEISGMGGGIALKYSFYSDFRIKDHSADLAKEPPARVTLINTHVENNIAAGGGGIAWAEPKETNILRVTQGSVVAGNRANSIASSGATGGGGIFNYKGTVIITDSIINDNFSYNGGGINNRGGALTIEGSQFQGNNSETNEKDAPVIATGFGGAILSESGQVSIAESVFKENQSQFGGAIFYTLPDYASCKSLGDESVVIHNSCFLKNEGLFAVTSYISGDDIHLQECFNPAKNPSANASRNWWGAASLPDQNRVFGKVSLEPILPEPPSFCGVK